MFRGDYGVVAHVVVNPMLGKNTKPMTRARRLALDHFSTDSPILALPIHPNPARRCRLLSIRRGSRRSRTAVRGCSSS